MSLKIRLTDTKTERMMNTLRNQVMYLERDVAAKQRQIVKQVEHFLDLEEKYKKATKRAHTLQLENNRYKKIIGKLDSAER